MADVILVVDDEPTIQQSLALLLDEEGFIVRCATNGAEALSHHVQDPADVIISDVMMPELDGIRLVNELRGRGDGTPILLMSAVVPNLGKLPAVRFIAKPFDVNTLLRLLKQSLDEREQPASDST